MNIFEIKQTMQEIGISVEVMEQFVFPKTKDETLEEKIAFVNQMDKILTKDQILTVMEEQGCMKNKPAVEFMLKLKDKPIEERIEILNAMDIAETAHSRLNEGGTLSIYWNHYDENGKYRCVCPLMNGSSKPTTVSITFCGCCSGHIKYHYVNFLEVKLRLLDTVSSPISSNGEKQCEHLFEIVNN